MRWNSVLFSFYFSDSGSFLLPLTCDFLSSSVCQITYKKYEVDKAQGNLKTDFLLSEKIYILSRWVSSSNTVCRLSHNSMKSDPIYLLCLASQISLHDSMHSQETWMLLLLPISLFSGRLSTTF